MLMSDDTNLIVPEHYFAVALADEFANVGRRK